MSTRSGYDRIDTEQSVERAAVVGAVVLAVLIAALYMGHAFTQLILALGSALQV